MVFLITIIVNNAIWYVISCLVSKYYYKSKGTNDQKYLIRYGLSKIKSRHKTVKTAQIVHYFYVTIFTASFYNLTPHLVCKDKELHKEI